MYKLKWLIISCMLLTMLSPFSVVYAFQEGDISTGVGTGEGGDSSDQGSL